MYRRRPSAAEAEAASLAAALSLIEVLLRVLATSLTAASGAFSTLVADMFKDVRWVVDGDGKRCVGGSGGLRMTLRTVGCWVEDGV